MKSALCQLVRFRVMVTLLLSLAAATRVAGMDASGTEFWPRWRGPLGTGVAPAADPPLEWSENKNVAWKAAIPGFGTSTPIVWGDRVFILTAIPAGKGDSAEAGGPTGETGPVSGSGRGASATREPHQFVVLCLDRKTGSTVWRKVAKEAVPHEGHHSDHGYASASPVTDGRHVIAYFGSRGLHCYDLSGKLEWSREYGPMRTRNSFGEGASPALHGDKVIVYRDDENNDDFIVALDKATGKEIWRTPRNEPTGWSTPVVVEFQGKAQVVVNGTGKVRSYDVETGRQLWECAGQTGNPIPTPVADAQTVYVTSGFRGSALYAIALGHTGNLEDTDALRWKYNKNTPYVPSPLLVDGLLYTVTGNSGVLSCFDTATGKPRFEGEKLEGVTGIYASPVAAKGRVYVLGRDGACLVLKQGPKLEILARNKIQDKADASIALAGGDLFLRGHRSLYCIREQ